MKRGLGMHKHHRHPTEVNDQRLREMPTSGKIWSRSDDSRLLRKAHSLWNNNMSRKELYGLLHSSFPNRSAEAIKKRLQNLEWKPDMTVESEAPSDTIPNMTTTWHLPQPQREPSSSDGHPLVLTKNKAWTREEELLVMLRAQDAWEKGITKKALALKIALVHKSRSADAIGKRLTILKWKPMEESTPTTDPPPPQANILLHPEGNFYPMSPANGPPGDPPDSSPPSTIHEAGPRDSRPPGDPPDSPSPSTIQEGGPRESTEWRRQVLDHVKTSLENKGEISSALHILATKLLDGTVTTTEAATVLDKMVTDKFPSRWKDKQPAKIQQVRKLSKREVRRVQYAKIQKCFNQKRKDAANTVLEGNWRDIHLPNTTEVDNKEEYWRAVFEGSEETRPCYLNDDSEWNWEAIQAITEEEVSTA